MPELLDIVGQDEALTQLQRAVAGGRRPHAYIFAGPEGVGRRTAAQQFARLLLCEAPAPRPNAGRLPRLHADFPLRTACGRCPSCRTVAAGTNPDYRFIYKELARYHDDEQVRSRKHQDLGIGVIRQFLIDPAGRAPVGRGGKVFVVRQAGRMSDAAENALLKTLEEPPPGVTIILLCLAGADLFATTRSRCQLVRFAPLPVEFVAQALTGPEVSAEEARFWAAMTGGSLGRSQRLAAEGLYQFKRKLVDALAAATLANAGRLTEMLRQAAEDQAKRIIGADRDLAASVAGRQAGGKLLEVIAAVYRDALTIACGADRPLINADQRDAVEKIARRFDPTQLADVLAATSRCERLLWRNVGAKTLWDNVAVTCATAAPLEVLSPA